MSNKNVFYLIKDATKHYSEKSLYGLIIKKFKWGKNYFGQLKKSEKFDYMPKTGLEMREFIKNMAYNLMFFPNFINTCKIYKNNKDLIAFVFPYIAFMNTFAYGLSYILSKLRQ